MTEETRHTHVGPRKKSASYAPEDIEVPGGKNAVATLITDKGGEIGNYSVGLGSAALMGLLVMWLAG